MKASELITTLESMIAVKLPAFVWGPPGIGKSSIVKDIADRNGLEFIDLRLSLLDPTDLKGIPFFDSISKKGVWASPSFLPHDKDSSGILFLDEINSAPPAVQASAYQLVLDRKVGEYELPKGWSIIAAGNRENDRGVVYRMPPPLGNRFVHLEMDVDIDEWKKWAYSSGIEDILIAYLSYSPESLFRFDPNNLQKAFATPRSWSFVDKILKSPLPKELYIDGIKSAVGEEEAVNLVSFMQVAQNLPNIDEILLGDYPETPNDAKLLTVLVTGIVSALKRDYSEDALNCAIDYSMILPPEFAVMLVKELQLNGFDLEESESWSRWVEKFAYLLG